MPNSNNFVDWALEYAAVGWRVFPLAPGTKVPLRKSTGYLDATDVSGTIREMWAPWPDANIGVATGNGGVVVLDIDRRHGGDQSLAQIEAELEPLPPGPVVRTGDGEHRYFSAAGQTITSRDVAHGVQLRGDGAYVVAPPSIHPNRRSYEWIQRPRDMAELPELPTWIRALRPSRIEYTTRAFAGSRVSTSGRTDLGAALTRLLSDPEVLPVILPIIGLPEDLQPGGRSVRCPLCHERHPSASLFVGRNGVVVMRSWHACAGDEFWPLAAVYAARVAKRPTRLDPAELAAWSLRLLVAAGVVIQPVAPPHLLRAPASAADVYVALMLTTVAANQLTGASSGVAFTRKFGRTLTGLSEYEFRAGWDWLRDKGHVTQTAARAGRTLSLWLPTVVGNVSNGKDGELESLMKYFIRDSNDVLRDMG